MIKIKNLRWAFTGYTLDLNKKEEKQIGRKIEKWLLKQNIISEVET